MEVVARLIELRPDSAKAVEEWKQFIEERRDAALEVLRAEGVAVESWFELELHGKSYLLCYMRADSLCKSQQQASQSCSDIDAYHQRFKQQNWVRGGGMNARLLVDLLPEDDRQLEAGTQARRST